MKKVSALCLYFFLSIQSAGIFAQNTLVEDEHVKYVKGHCSACHSLSLITQNRMTRARWKDTIRWMQETQGLWPLGEAEPFILDYLAKHYAPIEQGRRPPLAKHLMPPIEN